MQIRHLCSIAAILLASLLLTGCYVTSTVAPANGGFDTRLAGTWAGLDEGKVAPGRFLYFSEGTKKKEPRMVLVSPEGVAVYDLRTVRSAKGGAFAVRTIMTDDKDDNDKQPPGFILGVYEFRGQNLWFNIFDSDKIGALVDAGKLKGNKSEGKYFDVTLTGSPEEITQFLLSPEAQAAVTGEGSTLGRRLRR